MDNQTTYAMPGIGDKARYFEAVTTTGNLKFLDYNKGRWICTVL